MTDTNVIVSALLFPESLPAAVLLRIAVNYDLVLCDYIIEELRNVVSRKRPALSADIDALLARLPYERIRSSRESAKQISDAKDQPILNAAIFANVDIIVSGDKHFLQLNLERPKTMSPAQFWRMHGPQS